jgi:hypothetical protein
MNQVLQLSLAPYALFCVRAYLKKGGETMENRKNNKVLIGEGHAVAHVDHRTREAEPRLPLVSLSVHQKCGDNALLAVLAPNMMQNRPQVDPGLE